MAYDHGSLATFIDSLFAAQLGSEGAIDGAIAAGELYPERRAWAGVVVEQVPKHCAYCNKKFLPVRDSQSHCSKKCATYASRPALRPRLRITCACGKRFVQKRPDQINCKKQCKARQKAKRAEAAAHKQYLLTGN